MQKAQGPDPPSPCQNENDAIPQGPLTLMLNMVNATAQSLKDNTEQQQERARLNLIETSASGRLAALDSFAKLDHR
eukprot:9365745-Pyramimonas_sp.AAC.2